MSYRDDRVSYEYTPKRVYSIGDVNYYNTMQINKVKTRKIKPIIWKQHKDDLKLNRIIIVYYEDELAEIKEYADKQGYLLIIKRIDGYYAICRQDKSKLLKSEKEGGFEDIWKLLQLTI